MRIEAYCSGQASMTAMKHNQESHSFFSATYNAITSACVCCARETAYFRPVADSSEKSMGTRILRTLFMIHASLFELEKWLASFIANPVCACDKGALDKRRKTTDSKKVSKRR